MLYAGESVTFIARRIMICASEDVGNADPMALVVAVSAAEAVHQIGMPEAQIILSQAAAYVACAPKSNSAVAAIGKAMDAVKNGKTGAIPLHLMDAHDYKNHYAVQQYLPDELKGTVFYEPSDMGYEKKIKEHLKRLKEESYEA